MYQDIKRIFTKTFFAEKVHSKNSRPLITCTKVREIPDINKFLRLFFFFNTLLFGTAYCRSKRRHHWGWTNKHDFLPIYDGISLFYCTFAKN